ncbi:Prolyl 4-hydroxylase [Paramyrothecium foliicola]|nr:Prolyl 4-hydroxylase [Paramyrothecium foliicola]
MLSYIVGAVAVLIFFSDPIGQLLFPGQQQHQQTHGGRRLSPRPQLNESLLALELPGDAALECPPDAYTARILRTEPLVVYLENFLSEEERKHLLEISDPLFEPSTVTNDAHSAERDTTVRDSSVALIPRTTAVRCIERRALAFQGPRRDVWLERLRTQRYEGPAGHYSHHYDWSANSGGWGRVSSFMAWVDRSPDLGGGGTEFPLMGTRAAPSESWCRLVECPEAKAPSPRAQEAEGSGSGSGSGPNEDDHEAQGTTFRVVPGNAVYWENFAPSGRGYEETWHAGLPVAKGVKVGLNIWSFGRIE